MNPYGRGLGEVRHGRAARDTMKLMWIQYLLSLPSCFIIFTTIALPAQRCGKTAIDAANLIRQQTLSADVQSFHRRSRVLFCMFLLVCMQQTVRCFFSFLCCVSHPDYV